MLYTRRANARDSPTRTLRMNSSISTSPSYRYCTCRNDSPNSRNLVVFIDGTANKPGDRSTNVVKLYDSMLVDSSQVEQCKYYLKGRGAYAINHVPLLGRLGRTVWNSLEMAFAWNAEENVKEAYSWLVGHYRKGDQIYLFGFSRGAYQVRTLASLIHEIGLVKKKEQIEAAYKHYVSVDPHKLEPRKAAAQFKKAFCWPGVRVHFVGVWDTVSSLGLVKKAAHATEPATVTNACHFRHALALDECRVTFMPEYFLEMNAHHDSVRSSRSANSDIKEVWFAGSHSDVGGGTIRPHDKMDRHSKGNGPSALHAGSVPLLWMRREAAANGLVFKPEEFAWSPEDIDFGTRNTMTSWWRILEILPIRHQISFSGLGKHKRRWHLSRPRSIIPGQLIHTSVLSANMYTPRATLRHGICIPIVPQGAPEDLWTAELPDERETTHLLSFLLRDPRVTLGYLEKVMFLLESSLGNGQIRSIPRPEWSLEDVGKQSSFAQFAITVIYDVTSHFTVPEELLCGARASLCAILSSPDYQGFHRTLCTLRILIRHQTLRQRYIGHDEVISALMLALEWTVKNSTEDLFAFVVDGLHHLIRDDDLRSKVVKQLCLTSNGTETEQPRLSVALGVKSPTQLISSLKMIATLAQYEPDLCETLKPKIYELATKGRRLGGSATVEALVALNAPLSNDIHFSNILGYLDNTLPRLDVEVGDASSPGDIDKLPTLLLARGSGGLDDGIMQRLISAVKSRDTHERTMAILTLLKLCRDPIIRRFCSQNMVLDIFMRQLEQKRTSLLAAYALKICLEHTMWSSSDFPRAAQLIVAMLDRGWFDDAVGRVEGREIFRGLMTSADLRQNVIDLGVIATLVKKLGVGKPHDVRMSLAYLDILGEETPLELASIVADGVTYLKSKDIKVQKKGVKILAALAETTAGEQAIIPQVTEIVRMLLPTGIHPSIPPFGPSAALYDLSKNDTIRKIIRDSPEFNEVKTCRDSARHSKKGLAT